MAGLRKSPGEEPFLDEPECQRAVEDFEAIGAVPSFSVRPEEAPIRDLPKTLGRYELTEELGRGGMGTVYLAHDTQLDRQVALKIPHFKPDENPELLERFYREARAAATIEHPNRCPVYDVGEIDGFPYISMALVRGESLARLIKSKQLTQREAAEIVRKLAVAVDKAHAQGIVHRDIKPSNVMITEEGEPILMDFGLAQRWKVAVVRLTHAGLIVGTPSYMAPEQVEGDPEMVGPGCDVYSFGVVLYELLTGEVPFRGSLLSVLSQLATDQPEPLSARDATVDRRLEEICIKAMAKQPADRYRSAAAMAEALQRYVQARPQAAGPPSRRRWLAWGSAAAAAFLLVATLIYLKTGEGTLILEVNQPDVKVTIDGDQVHIKSPRDEISVRVGRHQLEVSKDGFETHTESFAIRRGGEVEVKATLAPMDTSAGNYLWQSYNGHQYALTREYGSWEQAEAEAIAAGGHLVKIDNQAENDWLATNLTRGVRCRGNSESGYNLVWIGLERTAENGNDPASWRWRDGATAKFWNSPSDFASAGRHMYLHGSDHSATGTWNANPLHDVTDWAHPLGIIERREFARAFNSRLPVGETG